MPIMFKTSTSTDAPFTHVSTSTAAAPSTEGAPLVGAAVFGEWLQALDEAAEAGHPDAQYNKAGPLAPCTHPLPSATGAAVPLVQSLAAALGALGSLLDPPLHSAPWIVGWRVAPN